MKWLHRRAGSKPDVGGTWLLLERKKASWRSSKGPNCCVKKNKKLSKYYICTRCKTCACFVSGGVRASGKDARHGGDPSEAAARGGTLHCSSHRLHRSGPSKHSWRYFMVDCSFFATRAGLCSPSPCCITCCPRSRVQWMATSSGCCVAWGASEPTAQAQQ